MKILLFGKNGQVGWELQRSLMPLGELIALGRDDHGDLCGDLTDLDGLRRTVADVAPDVIVNAAAYTAVDRAESEPQLAAQVNAEAPGVLAQAASQQDALLVHYSTDYVFDGEGERPWQEEDAAAPINVYGRTKWEGEEAIRSAGGRHLILRTQWVYAARGSNFLLTMLRLAAERERLQVVGDQFGAPTSAELIADVTAHVLRRAATDAELPGTYHLAARGVTSWHGFASYAIARAREGGWPVRVPEAQIESIATEAFPTAAKRPHNSRLAVDRIEQAFGLPMPPWQAGVDRVVAEQVQAANVNTGGAR